MDKVPFIIDGNTYKVMNYLYRHKEVKLHKLNRKFGDETAGLARALCPHYYAAYRDEDGRLTFDTSVTSTDGSIGLTPLGNKYVEDRREAFIKWFVPLVTSTTSVAVSIIALAISIFTR